MATVTLDNVTLDFPIYGIGHRSLRTMLFARTGGLIRHGSDRQQRVVVRALENVTLRFDHGDRVGLVGHNGAGKTTLLKVIAGVYRPVAGSMRVEGRISPLFNASPGIDLEDTGYENIVTCGMFLGMNKAEISRKLGDIEETCELGEYLSLPIRTYSAGMMTRLSFALATTIDPDVLLLDEGIAAGDARFAARAERRMQALIDRSSILVLASHSDGMIAAMCNKAVLMEKGHVISVGEPREVIELYKRRNAGGEQAGWSAPLASSGPTAPVEATDKPGSSATRPIELVYQTVHTVSARLPTDLDHMSPFGGSSILGYFYERRGSETSLRVQIRANAYSPDDNKIVIAVFRDGQLAPLTHQCRDVESGGHALFDLAFDVPIDGASALSLDVRIGPAQPGNITINGPEGEPRPDIPLPALIITPMSS